MKKLSILLVLLLQFSIAQAQHLQLIEDRSHSQDFVVQEFSANDAQKIRSIVAAGDVSFSSPDGFLRLTAVDEKGLEFLVYESYENMASQDGHDVFKFMALETFRLSNYRIRRVRAFLHDATLENLTLTVDGLSAIEANTGSKKVEKSSRRFLPSAKPQDLRKHFFSHLNERLKEREQLWRAAENPLSMLSFAERKEMYGGTIPNLKGYEYYSEGIFSFFDDDNFPTPKPSAYVKEFDWRSRHGANKVGSPYYQHPVNGWITPLKNQLPCASCWAHAAVAATECNAKLFKNTFYNFDLSEQELISCSRGSNIRCDDGWFYARAINYIRRHGIHNEEWFPKADVSTECKSDPNYLYQIKITGVDTVFSYDKHYSEWNLYPYSEERNDSIKAQLLRHPIGGETMSWGHAMLLVGYKVLQEGDILFFEKQGEKVTLSSTDPATRKYIGQTAWIFKNSYGEERGVHGYSYVVMNIGQMRAFMSPNNFSFEYYPQNDPKNANPELEQALLAPVNVYDKDGDGYYWWGIGPRPANMPEGAQLEADGDDSDPTVGPMDKYGNLKVIKDYDLYIQDNDKDNAFEPNTTIENFDFWSSPDIWVRNAADKVEEHQNPIPDAVNFVNIRVHNRGPRKCTTGRLSLYWAKGGTNLQWPDGWNNYYSESGVRLGDYIGTARIVDLEPGSSYICQIPWMVPNPKDYKDMGAMGGNQRWHFCLLAIIEDRNDVTPGMDEESQVADFVINNNNVAQKNVSVLYVDEGDYEAVVSVSNHLAKQETFSLEFIDPDYKEPAPVTTNPKFPPVAVETNNNLFDVAKVQAQMSEELYMASHNGEMPMFAPGQEDPTVNTITQKNRVIENVVLQPNQAALIKMSVHFTKPMMMYGGVETRRLIMVQRDNQGHVVGGETFVIKRGKDRPIHVDIDSALTVNPAVVEFRARDNEENPKYAWYNSEGSVVSTEKSMMANALKEDTYRLEVISQADGYLSSTELHHKPISFDGSLRVSDDKTELMVSNLPSGSEYQVNVISIAGNQTVASYAIPANSLPRVIDIRDLPAGVYAVNVVDGTGQVFIRTKFAK